MRVDGRQADELRPVTITLQPNKYAEGSVLIEFGDTKVLCTASIEERVPPFMKGQGKGWITAEYAMLPRATQVRNHRESAKGKLTGRTMEIQRLIGRALRSVVDLHALGERTITLDCDVLQADGGTRTTSITGAYVALALAVDKLNKNQAFAKYPLTDFLASVSVGVIQDRTLLDLNYEEDSKAKVDMPQCAVGRLREPRAGIPHRCQRQARGWPLPRWPGKDTRRTSRWTPTQPHRDGNARQGERGRPPEGEAGVRHRVRRVVRWQRSRRQRKGIRGDGEGHRSLRAHVRILTLNSKYDRYLRGEAKLTDQEELGRVPLFLRQVRGREGPIPQAQFVWRFGEGAFHELPVSQHRDTH